MTNGFGVTPDEASLAGVFRNALMGQGINPASVFGRITSSLQNPLMSAYNVSGLTNPNPQGDFGSFLGGGLQSAASGARGQLNQLGGGGAQGLPQGVQDIFAGAAPGTTSGTDLENLARLGLRDRYAPVIAGRYGSDLINSAQGRYESELAGAAGQGQDPRNYAAALSQLLGLNF